MSKTKKAHLFSLEQFVAASYNGLENAKAGLVALAEFLKRSASEHVNQRDCNHTELPFKRQHQTYITGVMVEVGRLTE